MNPSKRPDRREASVVVVGSLNIDNVMGTVQLPRPGETLLGGPARRGFGGKGANQAVAARRMGARVQLIGAVGADADGESYRHHLRGIGVDDRGVTSAQAQTGSAAVLVAQDGENCIVVDPGANAELTIGLIEQAETIIASADVLVVSLEIPLDAARAAIGIAQGCGVPVVLNPAPAHADAPYDRLRGQDVITPNQHEAEVLARASTSSLNEHTNVVVTRGREGVELIRRGSRSGEQVPAPPVTAVDTTGAGDVFTGALAWGVAHGASLRVAVDIAIATSAYAVTMVGAQLGPLPAELLERNRSCAHESSVKAGGSDLGRYDGHEGDST